MTLEVRVATTPEEKTIGFDLRLLVFVDEQGHSAELQMDAHDEAESTVHFLGKDVEQDKFVAVARCMVDSERRQARIGRVAVLSECRGKNYGVVLMEFVEAAVRDRVDSFILLAQVDKRGFYEKLGYRRLDDEIHIDECKQVHWMIKHLSGQNSVL